MVSFSSIHFQKSAAYERKGNITRAKLMDAAINVMAREGVSGASIQDIARFAGTANGTFYIHFKNKADLIEQVGIAIVDAISKSVHDPAFDHPDPAHLVARHLFAFLAIAGAEPTWIPLIIDSLSPTEKNCAILERGIRIDIDQGRTSDRFDVPECKEPIAFVLAICRTGLERIRDGGDLATVQLRAMEAALRILGVDPGEARSIAHEISALPLWKDFVFPTISSSRRL